MVNPKKNEQQLSKVNNQDKQSQQNPQDSRNKRNNQNNQFLIKPKSKPKIKDLFTKDTSYIIPYKNIKIDKNKKLGGGGFGVVYKGELKVNNKNTTVAVKQLLLIKMNKESMKEFMQEINIMLMLKHPNILPIYGICIEPGNYSIVMQYMPKGSLYDVIHSQSLSGQQIFNIATDIGEGLSYMHNKKPPILHRDLKSLNILINAKMQAKIGDFGLSRIKQETNSITKTKQDVGTCKWMAPEVIKRQLKMGKARYTAGSDMYSYGMILWEMITSKIPWEKQINAAVMVLVGMQNKREKIPKKCPVPIKALIELCWKDKPEDRPTAKKVLKMLKNNEQKIIQYKVS